MMRPFRPESKRKVAFQRKTKTYDPEKTRSEQAWHQMYVALFMRFCVAYHAWRDGRISDAKFAAGCRTLWKQAGCHSRWYSDLIWVDDEFDLAEQGILHPNLERIKEHLENILRR